MSELRPFEQVLVGLRSRYAKPDYAFLREIFAGNRRVDAVAVKLGGRTEIHGLEIKVSRSDWLREMKDVLKADDRLGYFDFWWLAVSSKEIVKPGELPENWGLLGLQKDGRMRTLKAATPLRGWAMGQEFIASLVARALIEAPAAEEYQAVREKAYKEGLLAAKKEALRAYRDRLLHAQTVETRWAHVAAVLGMDSYGMERAALDIRAALGVRDLKAQLENALQGLVNAQEKISRQLSTLETASTEDITIKPLYGYDDLTDPLLNDAPMEPTD